MFKKPDIDLRALSTKANIRALCESPIEIEFGCFLVEHAREEFIVVPQYPMGGFRFDFAICDEKARPFVLVECDGKEFHSTPDQLENDRNKTEFAESKGVPLFRLKGSTIYRAAEPIAGAAISLARALRGVRK